MSNYTVFHCHSDMSNGTTNIDSVTKFTEYVDLAAKLGMKAMAFSEHGSVFAWDLKKEYIEKNGMKYIHAEEFYVTGRAEEKIKDNWHCVLIAKNLDGVHELNGLATKSFNRHDNHYFYSPRIFIEELMGTSDNIIITTACLGGILNEANERAQQTFIEFLAKNKHRSFLEVQHHNVNEQKTYNRKLLGLSKKYGIPLIAGTDTHCLNQEHALGRKMLQKSKGIVFANEEDWDLTFKTYEELVEAYRVQGSIPEEDYLQAIENTNVMADMVDTFEIDRHTKYPKIYDNPVETFKKKINEGYKNSKYLRERYPQKVVADRIKEEFAVYEKVGAIDFMLLESYIREWERNNDVQSGPGRGSVSGSLIAYALGITQMDSLKFNLNFFRFMNPARVTNADIDTDYCAKDREKIKYFLLHDKLNLPNIKTSEIITFNTIAMKGAIKDMCRALDFPLNVAQTISDAVELDDAKKWTIDDSWRQKYPELFKYVDIVSGTIVSIGSHPSGVLVSDRNIDEDVGLCSISGSDYPVSMLDMHGLDGQMYVKLDILGLDNIGTINECCKMLGIERLTPDNTDLNDENVWRSIREDTTMIFQWESESAQAYLKKFMSDETIAKAKEKSPNFSYLKWFSFGNGLLRPACASYRDQVADGEFYDNGFKELNEFLAPEAGRVCMQETIMRFLVEFCGYSQAESDNVRRAIAKKKGTATLLPEIESRFIEYSSTHYDISKERCSEIIKPFIQIILDAASYSFSWNHSDAYSCIGYISGYLRYYYPLQFVTASLNTFTGDEEKTINITNYAKRNNITIKSIKFRHSGDKYTCDPSDNSIYKGVASVKYLNADVSRALYDMRNEQFDSFVDLLRVFPGNSRQLDILIKLDYFSEFGKAQKLLKIVALYEKLNGRKQLNKDDLPVPEDIVRQFCVNETAKRFQFDDKAMSAMLSHLCSMIPDTDIPAQLKIQTQIDVLGYADYVDPDRQRDFAVLDIDDKYNKMKITLYSIGYGKTAVVKLQKKQYEEFPFVVGDIIKCNFERKGKWSKVGDKFVQSNTEFDTFIKAYIIC